MLPSGPGLELTGCPGVDLVEFRGCSTKGTCYVQDVAIARAAPPKRLTCGCGANQHNVGKDGSVRGLGRIAPGKWDRVQGSQLMQALKEALRPACRRSGGERKGKEGCDWGRSHRGNIAETAGEAAVSHRLRAVPVAPEVPAFQGEIRRDKDLAAWRGSENGAVIADPKFDRTTGAARELLPDGLD